jgi:hypothetical protein
MLLKDEDSVTSYSSNAPKVPWWNRKDTFIPRISFDRVKRHDGEYDKGKK